MNFFRRLRARTEREPSAQAEQALFRQLDAEFAKTSETSGSPAGGGFWAFFGRVSVLRYVPLTAVALGLVVFAGRLLPERERATAPVATIEGDAEFYESLEDWMLNASDEDWEVLLASEGEGG